MTSCRGDGGVSAGVGDQVLVIAGRSGRCSDSYSGVGSGVGVAVGSGGFGEQRARPGAAL
jgi:hypothetical protein